MSHFKYNPGLGSVGAYQVAAVPYVSGAIDCSSQVKKLYFPSVTSWISVSNTSTTDEVLRIGFSARAVNGSGDNGSKNYYTLSASGSTGPMKLKVTELYLYGSSQASVMAGLTTISNRDINNTETSPSGSNWSGSLTALVDRP